MAKANKKESTPEDETLENVESVEANAPKAEGPADDDEAAEPDSTAEGVVTFDAPDAVESLHAFTSQHGDLQSRITRAARAIAAHGGQEKVHALNQLELLTGRVKMALPAAIATVEDEDLRAGLEFLLRLL